MSFFAFDIPILLSCAPCSRKGHTQSTKIAKSHTPLVRLSQAFLLCVRVLSVFSLLLRLFLTVDICLVCVCTSLDYSDHGRDPLAGRGPRTGARGHRQPYAVHRRFGGR